MAEEAVQGQTEIERAPYLDDAQLAQEQWCRFLFYLDNGHADFVEDVNRNYRYWRGNGGQWADDDREYMESVQGRKCIENNEILPAVQTAVGEQIATRTTLAFKPKKNGATEETASALTKLAMHVLAENGYPRKEKQLWKNGLIKRRGYLQVRMNYEKNLRGEISIMDRDPRCIMPDLFSESYDPKDWSEVISFSWLSLDQIEGFYGPEARQKVEKTHQFYSDNPILDELNSRNQLDNRVGFATGGTYQQFEYAEAGERRYRIIDRQFYRYTMALHYVDPKTGDIEMVPTGKSIEEARTFAADNGYVLQRLNAKRIHWRVTTRFTTIHNDWSPYETFDIIPFFYLFDYGDTLSMVDNAIGPQDLENKALTSYLHIVNTTSNSGWKVPKKDTKSALTNMTTDDLRNQGMKTGLVMEYDVEIGVPEKITSNHVPDGIDRLIDRGSKGIERTTGMSAAEQGLDSPEISGIAVGRKQHQAKLQLGDPLDNLAFTRVLLGRKIVELAQNFMTEERIYKITGTDDYGRDKEEDLAINHVDPTGRIINDITVGEYEVDVSEQPMAATFEDTQFRQLMEMRESGVAIPDDEVVRRSNLTNKHDLADRLANPGDGGVTAVQQQMLLKKIEEIAANIELTKAKRQKEIASATNTNIQAMFGATNAGKVIAMTPGVAPLADELMLSAGFEDHNAAPVIPQNTPKIEYVPADVPKNTSPNFPPQADRGVTAGIESGSIPAISE